MQRNIFEEINEVMNNKNIKIEYSIEDFEDINNTGVTYEYNVFARLGEDDFLYTEVFDSLSFGLECCIDFITKFY